MKRIFTIFMSVTMFLVSFVPSLVSAASLETEGLLSYEELSEILYSPEDYLSWVESLDGEEADEFIQGFLALSEDEQNLFLRILHPDNFSEFMSASEHEIGTIGTVLIDNEEISFSVVDSYEAMLENNTPITIALVESYSPARTRNAGDREFTRTYTSSVLGLTVTRFNSTFRFRINTNTLNPTHALSVHATHSNLNPGVIVNNLRTSTEMFSGRAYGTATWRINATASLTFVSHDLSLQMRRNGSSNQSRIQATQGNNSTNWRAS